MIQEEVKTAPMNNRYKRESIEEVDKEIEELEAQRNQQEAEPEVTEEQEEDLNPEEKTFKKRYGDLRRHTCLLYTSPSPRDGLLSRMPSSA